MLRYARASCSRARRIQRQQRRDARGSRQQVRTGCRGERAVFWALRALWVACGGPAAIPAAIDTYCSWRTRRYAAHLERTPYRPARSRVAWTHIVMPEGRFGSGERGCGPGVSQKVPVTL
jgi:hypothetical protein